MLWMFLVLFHIAAYLLMANREQEKKDLEKRVNGSFIPVAPNRFPDHMAEGGYYDSDKTERARIAKRNREAVEEIDRVYKTVGALRELNKL